MLEMIKGQLSYQTSTYIVIETGGLGYKVRLPVNVFSSLPSIGENLTLYLSEVIREDSHTLYGFLTREMRDLFEAICDVSGIGPKSGLGLLGHLTDPATLLMAIRTGDSHFISKAPGIGKKTAERLIVEMKDKINHFSFHPQSQDARLMHDAATALQSLGYSSAKASTAVKKALEKSKDTPDLSSLITIALKTLSK